MSYLVVFCRIFSCVHGVARGACISAGWDLSCVCGNFDVIRIGSARGDVTRLMRYAMVSAVRSYELQSMMSVMQSVMSMMQFVTNEIRPACAKWVAGDTVSCWTVNRVLSTSGSVRNYASNTCLHPCFILEVIWNLILMDTSSVIGYPDFPDFGYGKPMKLFKFGATGHVTFICAVIG